MKYLSNLNVSSRFARRICYFSALILCSICLFIITINQILPYFSSNHVFSSRQSHHQELSSNRSGRLSLANTRQRDQNNPNDLPLIYQPASNAKILRALLTFYPNDQKSTFESEFRWFYLSWTNMMLNESSLWRTDLLVYTTTYEDLFKELDCVYNEIRQNSTEKPRCRVFPYVRVKNRASNHRPSGQYQMIDAQRSKNLYDNLRDYGYIDSINTVLEYEPSYSMYDYILRTDIDCFLTDDFARYVPYDQSLLVGHGGYSTLFNDKRLKRIAHDMNWGYADKNALGSTWYGPAFIAHRLANFTVTAMIHLSLDEFTTPERQQKLGVMLWPEWHYGVLLLYGGHLAINHLIATENFRVEVANQLLDQGVTSKDPTDLKKNHRLHLHCWHGSDPFSKFEFKAGKYNHISPASLVSDTSASGLAMRTALESKNLTLKQLKEKLLEIKKE